MTTIDSFPGLHLEGLPGAGKGTVGIRVARIIQAWLAERHVDVPLPELFIDVDTEVERLIEAEVGRKMSIDEYIKTYGEERFRDLETKVVLGLPRHAVIALGGGSVKRKANRRALKRLNCPCLWLDAADDVLIARITSQEDAGRPLLEGHTTLRDDLASRRALRTEFYDELADWRLETDNLVEDEVAGVIFNWLLKEGYLL